MKELFRGYYKLTDEEISSLWSDGFVSFDTNVLLNIYRYSEETRNELFGIIEKFSKQIWLPYHVAYEFHKNRVTVIADQINVYENTIKQFAELETQIIKNLKAPHLSNDILKNFEATIKEALADLENKKKFCKDLLYNDHILEKISALFNSKVGQPFSDEEIKEIEKEGDERFKKKVPPGFKDSDKSENRFGDLIIWKELIQKATSEQRPFLFIIDDVKDDWWLNVMGQKVAPRYELRQELFIKAKQLFHLYTTDRFIEFASDTIAVKKEVIDEIREIRLENFNPSFWNSEHFKIAPSESISNLLSTNKFFENANALAEFQKNQPSLLSETALNILLQNKEMLNTLKNAGMLNSIMNYGNSGTYYKHLNFLNSLKSATRHLNELKQSKLDDPDENRDIEKTD